MGLCKNCKYRSEMKTCNHYKIDEADVDKSDEIYLEYPYQEGGWFEVGDNFGCVLFDKKVLNDG
jgi:hypothetical protein